MKRTPGARTLEQFAHACGGRLLGADRTYTGVSTDTRSIAAGELFVALHGPNFNGNTFVEAAA
jgi:UDP-N-acetylmuramoyl-tripeptide--D-alanyl-D-alanine ligase